MRLGPLDAGCGLELDFSRKFQHVRYVRYVNMIKTVYGLSMKLVGLMLIDGGFEAFGA
jgi:hypothetical protein